MISTKKGRQALFHLFIVFLFTTGLIHSAFAQAGRSELSGYIVDPNGAVIVGPTVELPEIVSGTIDNTTTNGEGLYLFLNKRPGDYSVRASAENFLPFTRNVTLTTGERIRLDLDLEVQGLDQHYIVPSDAPLLRSDTSSLGQVIDN